MNKPSDNRDIQDDIGFINTNSSIHLFLTTTILFPKYIKNEEYIEDLP